jgi:hypothetical protein
MLPDLTHTNNTAVVKACPQWLTQAKNLSNLDQETHPHKIRTELSKWYAGF